MSHIEELQLLQQNREHLLQQKQQIQNQMLELDSALQQLASTPQAYKIVGKIMIAASSSSLQKELQDKKEVAELRLQNIISQEEKLQSSIEAKQLDVIKEMGKNKK